MAELEKLSDEVRMVLAGRVAQVESDGSEEMFSKVLKAALAHDDDTLVALAYLVDQKRMAKLAGASERVRGMRWRRLAEKVRPILDKWSKDFAQGKTAALIPRNSPNAESELSRGLKGLFSE